MIIQLLLSVLPLSAFAQTVDTAAVCHGVLTLEQAIQIALTESPTVKVADLEIEKTGYARKGSYASLLPNIDGSAAYQRTIKKQVMYMDGDGFDISSMLGDALGAYLLPLYAKHPDVLPPAPSGGDSGASSSSSDGFEVGRLNTWSAGITATMPLVNFQLWQSLKISDMDVELAVEKARSSRLEMVTQVKQAFFGCLLAKEAFEVYKSVYENALDNFGQIEKKYKVQKASELDMARAKTTLANAIPNVFDAENAIIMALWQLKAVMGVDLDAEIDVAGALSDYGESILEGYTGEAQIDLNHNSTMRELALQAEELARAVKIQQYANLPSLALAFSYSMNAMTNDFEFSEYKWSPYSYVGLSLNIPIFAGGKRANSIKQARVQASQLGIQRDNAERQLRIAIRQSLNTMNTATKSYAAAEEAVTSAQKAFDIAQKSYNVGRSTLTDLNDAQLALTQSRLGMCQAIYSFLSAKASLEQVVGADFLDEDGNVQLNNTYSNE